MVLIHKKTSKINNTINNVNNKSIKKRLSFKDIRIYGKPYFVKIFILLFIVATMFIFSQDLFSLSINASTYIATLAIDMWLIKNKKVYFTFDMVKIHNGFLIIIFISLVESVVVAFYCAFYNLGIERIKPLPFCFIIFLSFLGIASPIFELIFNIPED